MKLQQNSPPPIHFLVPHPGCSFDCNKNVFPSLDTTRTTVSHLYSNAARIHFLLWDNFCLALLAFLHRQKQKLTGNGYREKKKRQQNVEKKHTQVMGKAQQEKIIEKRIIDII